MSDYSAFGISEDIGVGFSDTLLLIVSVAGFIFLAVTVYVIILTRLKSRKEIEEEQDRNDEDYGEQLLRADASTLNRGQRRARARVASKRRETEDSAHLTRKERQRVEREERRILEEKRRAQQLEREAEEQRLKREREQKEAIRIEEKQRRLREEKERRQCAETLSYQTFLTTSSDTMSVDEFLCQLQECRSISLAGFADRFAVSQDTVKARIEQLLHEERVAGIFTDDDAFVYFSDEELHAVAQAVTNKGICTLHDVAELCTEFIKK